ncbi:Putative cytochrome P450 124 [Nonomuraea coxensis DSM 45129]|uniref:Cytochrome P450 124 n=1 Tax=Nonomuraea coxensis DSM 45129 TaxID=1122611 RepID=A0ABX8UDF2_9ACTN|nr:Putative cytochrome P450 124 [Nonomuraea coxensis DSM 45129]
MWRPEPAHRLRQRGAHFCLDNHLVKLELRVLFGQLARRGVRSNFINGIKELPVTVS